MRKLTKFLFIAFTAILMLSFSAHKFYVGIYQINFVPEKKMLQITTRIFLDDINEALAAKYKQPVNLGEANETVNDIALMKKYITENMLITVNGKPVVLEFMSNEIEDNVLICYFRSTGISKITKFEIRNKILFDYVTEQQNIVQTNINGNKKSLLLTVSNSAGKIQY